MFFSEFFWILFQASLSQTGVSSVGNFATSVRANVCALEIANGGREAVGTASVPVPEPDPDPCVFQWRTERQNAAPLP